MCTSLLPTHPVGDAAQHEHFTRDGRAAVLHGLQERPARAWFQPQDLQWGRQSQHAATLRQAQL